MAENSYENGPICPYLIMDGAPTAQRTRPSGQNRCGVGSTPRAVSIHRQTASCLGPAFGKCVEYLAHAPEPEPEPPKRRFSFAAFDSTVAEAGLLILMIGMIAFALFAIAPRAAPSVSARGAGAASAQAVPTPENQPVAEPTPAAPTATPTPPQTLVAMSVAAPSPTAAKTKSYVVRAGDTLFSIARLYNVSVDALAKANGLSNPKALRAGQTLRIP